jgi:hypothetical protein
MEKVDPYLNYINIVLVVVIISTIGISYVFLSRINIFYTPNYEILFLILPCVFGGIAASLTTPGTRGIIAATVVGALSFCIWSSIYIVLLTIIAGTDMGSIVQLIIWIPATLIIGGILGVVGGIIGFIINISGLWKGTVNTK